MVHIKAIIFDLDGVLVDSRHLHYESLNKALGEINEKYTISYSEHLSKYDGLSTSVKLKKLTAEKGLPETLHEHIWQRKQQHSLSLIVKNIHTDERLVNVLESFSGKYMLFCASNSIKATVEITLVSNGTRKYFKEVYSNQDVKNTKPHPEIYMKCMVDNGLIPRECVIVEDSPIGVKSATLSGAHVLQVAGPSEVTHDSITSFIKECELKNNKMEIKSSWKGELQVVIPMAGLGSRFSEKGYDDPKPFIDVNGKPMIQVVIENLNLGENAKYIFIVRSEHEERARTILPKNSVVIPIDYVTEGAACTVLIAKNYIDPSLPLIIANCDQYLEWDPVAFLYESQNVDSNISVFESDEGDKKWSYASVNDDGFVDMVAEKIPISNIATTGIYYWSKAGDFVTYAERMIHNNIRVNNEFYVCPVYNEAIKDNKKVKVTFCKRMWSLGVPEDLEFFLANNNDLDST